MSYIPRSTDDVNNMLAFVGAADVEDLFEVIPADLRREGVNIPPPVAEPALSRHLEQLAASNKLPAISFLGAGCYDHYIPAAVNTLLAQGQFYTAYTPYQPEVSQGTLAVIFEFQTYVAALTGMDVANASMYDGATAAAEAVLMCLRLKPERGVAVVAPNVHPEYAQVISTYLTHIPGARLVTAQCCAPFGENGVVDMNRLEAALSDEVACFVMQTPNFFGLIETKVAEIAAAVHRQGALLVVITNPMALAIMTPPGAFGADVVVGEGQPFGSPMSFGGPGVGFFATRAEMVRQMPGRLVGKTVDAEGRPAYCLTIQTREQHIRREKATSNICSNHALGATAFTIYLSVVGRSGLTEIAKQNFANAVFAQYATSRVPGYKLIFEEPVFNEFVLKCPRPAAEIRAACLKRGVDPGLPLGTFFPAYGDCLLVAVTEKRTREDIELLCECLAAAGR